MVAGILHAGYQPGVCFSRAIHIFQVDGTDPHVADGLVIHLQPQYPAFACPPPITAVPEGLSPGPTLHPLQHLTVPSLGAVGAAHVQGWLFPPPDMPPHGSFAAASGAATPGHDPRSPMISAPRSVTLFCTSFRKPLGRPFPRGESNPQSPNTSELLVVLAKWRLHV